MSKSYAYSFMHKYATIATDNEDGSAAELLLSKDGGSGLMVTSADGRKVAHVLDRKYARQWAKSADEVAIVSSGRLMSILAGRAERVPSEVIKQAIRIMGGRA